MKFELTISAMSPFLFLLLRRKLISQTGSLTYFFLLFFVFSNMNAVLGQSAPNTEEEQFGTYKPNAGFRLATTDKGVINFRIYAYLRYLNQTGLEDSYTDAFGDTTHLDLRQDLQVNKVNIQFNGWLLDPRFRYLFYIWTNNTAQGQGAQVVVAGNLQYRFYDFLNVGGGINALPSTRTTSGNFPFWLTVDNRLAAEEFFRGSYTTGIWANGRFAKKFDYQVMLGNNLSQLGIDAGQLDAKFNTLSGMIAWMPTTGEYGLPNNNLGDFENHQKVATRIAAHYTQSHEDRQGVPASEAFENVTIRLSDGNVIFKPDLFGQGIQIDKAFYQMACFNAGAKYKGFSLEGEFYLRTVSQLKGSGIESLGLDKFNDTGFQVMGSAMVVKESLQLYSTWASIQGEYGDPTDFRVGINWFPWHNNVVRWNFEYMRLKGMPVGGLSLPYAVGSTGSIVHSNFQLNF